MRQPPVEGGPRLGGDPRPAHPARRDRRRQPEGRVRDPRLGHAAGDRPDRGGVRLRAGLGAQPRLRGSGGRAARHARAQGRDRGRRREAQDVGVRPERGHGRRRQRRRPVLRADLLRGRAHRLHGGAVLGRHRDGGPIAGRRRAGRGSRDRRADGRHRRVQRRRRVPADRAGHAGAARLPRRVHRPPARLPDVRRDGDPDRARARRRRNGVHPALHPRRVHEHQHDHAASSCR